jgi:glycosyltransferase involved in cell wall biosynthesis
MADSLRILALNWRCHRHPQAGGSEVNLFEQARRWVKAGHTVTVLCADPGGVPCQEDVDGIEVRRMGGRFSVYFHVAFFVLRFGHKYDAILDISNGIPFWAHLWTTTPNVLVVHHVHHNQWFEELPWPLAAVGWVLEHKVVPWVYRHRPVIAVSPTTSEGLIDIGFRPEQLTIIYNGVYQPTKWPIPRHRGGQHIAYIGRLKHYKRVDLLITMFARLRDRFPDLHLDLVGDGDDRSRLQRLVKELGLEEHVTFYGFITEEIKARIMRSATVFATASTHEGWGIAVLEANTYACPAVAFNVPGLQVAIRDGETGYLADTEEEFCAALAKILGDSNLHEQLASNAQRWAHQFDWDSCAEQTLRMLELCRGTRHPAPSA